MNNKIQQVDAVLTGVSGEYLTAGELSRRGYVASITLRNTRGIDLVAANGNASKSVGIQVKTSRNKRKWLMNIKAEDYHSDTLFYIFVNLKSESERPEFFIVPSQVAANYIKTGHAKWLTLNSRNGIPHKDTNLRQFNDTEGKYLERWELLGL